MDFAVLGRLLEGPAQCLRALPGRHRRRHLPRGAARGSCWPSSSPSCSSSGAAGGRTAPSSVGSPAATGWHSVDVYPEAEQLPGHRGLPVGGPARSSPMRARSASRSVTSSASTGPRGSSCSARRSPTSTSPPPTCSRLLDDELNEEGVHLAFAEMRSRLQDLTLRYGLLETLDADHFYPTLETALAAVQAARAPYRRKVRTNDRSTPIARARRRRRRLAALGALLLVLAPRWWSAVISLRGDLGRALVVAASWSSWPWAWRGRRPPVVGRARCAWPRALVGAGGRSWLWCSPPTPTAWSWRSWSSPCVTGSTALSTLRARPGPGEPRGGRRRRARRSGPLGTGC